MLNLLNIMALQLYSVKQIRIHILGYISLADNIAESNNSELPKGRITATVEFTDAINKEGILENLKRIPLNPKYLDHKFNKYTYPIQDANTRTIINKLKKETSLSNFYFTGRFADWEYYNMDVAIGAAMDLCKTLQLDVCLTKSLKKVAFLEILQF